MLKTAVIMMTKLPIPGFCKNRLHEVLEAYESAEFQRLCIKDLTAMVLRSELPLYIYYASPGGYKLGDHVSEVSYIPQKGEDLGERMYHAVQQTLSQYEAVIVVGSDLPDLEPRIVYKAVQDLEQSDMVLGPCYDGGYYLLGTKAAHPEIFEGISWGSPQVLDQTLNKAKKAGLSLRLLETRRDIDTWYDIVDYYDRNTGVNRTDTCVYTEQLIKKYGYSGRRDRDAVKNKSVTWRGGCSK